MRSFIINTIALMLLATAGCQAASNQNQSILVIGDSLSAGLGVDPGQAWATLLQDRLTAQGYGYRVINASISGDTTSGGLRRLPRALEQHKPDIVIIELGGNDGLRGMPIDIIRRNMEEMIEMSLDYGAQVLLAGMQIPPNYGESYAGGFADIYPDLASEYDIGLIGFFMDGVALDATMMQPDGIHPNAKGQPLILQNVWEVLEPQLRISGDNAMDAAAVGN